MRNKKSPPIVKLAMLTAFTALVWVVFDVYRSFTLKPPPPVPPEITRELDPRLDDQALSELQRRIQLSPEQIGQTLLQSPTPETDISESSPEPEASEILEIIDTEIDPPSATEEAQIDTDV